MNTDVTFLHSHDNFVSDFSPHCNLYTSTLLYVVNTPPYEIMSCLPSGVNAR